MRLILEDRGEGYVAPATALEAEFRDLVRDFGLPEPVRQHSAGDAAAWIGRLDVAYPGSKLLIELDSRRHHTSKLDRDADQARDNRLMAAGWRVLRLSWFDLTERPAESAALVRAALSAAA